MRTNTLGWRLRCARAAAAAFGLMIAGSVSGAGFSFFEQGAKATAMGGAFAAQADDPSAIFYNPAGLGFQDHYSLMAGTTITSQLRGDFQGADPVPGAGVGEHEKKTTFFPSTLFLTAPVTSNLKFGIGVFSPFGLGVRWDHAETFSGRHISQNVQLKTFSVEPVLALRVTPEFSIAAGAEYRSSYVLLEQNAAEFDPFTLSAKDVAHVRLQSDTGHAWGWNAGFLWKAAPQLSIGASYRSAMTIDYTGTAKVTQRPTDDPAFDALVAANLPASAKAKTSLAYPAIADFGIALHHPPSQLTITMDAIWTEWSRYKSLDIVFPGGELPNIYRVTAWHNSWSYRVGVEKRWSALAVRAGFVYDQTPQPDQEVSPILPDANRRGYCVGVGYDSERFGLDLADMYLPFQTRNTHGKSEDGYNGIYKTTANLVGVSLRVSF